MPESFLLDWLQQLDLSALGDLNELDWTNIATYSALFVAVGGALWTSSKNFIQFLWRHTEGFFGFVVSTIVVFSLWYSLLRVHVSISFNLDKEIFDNCLWLSAILFTPYYLVHYRLIRGFFLIVFRSFEMLVDLLVFSWFPQKAEQNRIKWRNRATNAISAIKNSFSEFWQLGLKSIEQSPIPIAVSSSSQSISDETPDE